MIEKDPAKRIEKTAKEGRSWLYAAALIALSAILAVILQKHGLQTFTNSDIPANINLTVIPFSVIGTSQDNKSFGEGLTERLNAQLARLTIGRKLQITTATEARARTVKTPADARQQFGSNLALTGSFQYSNTSVRINCLLVDAATGRTLRTETITGDTLDPFGLQDRVTAAVVRMLGIELKPDERNALAARP
jgi:adenylate cyclase